MDEIVNKVAKSGLITIDLQDIKPQGERVFIDIKERLWQGIALKEKDFREWVRSENWEAFADKHVAVGCTVDAVIPSWAYMLVSSALTGIAKTIVFGDVNELERMLFKEAVQEMPMEEYLDGRVIIKGCGEGIPQAAYLYLTQRLQPHVKSMMFGEPCSTVPVYKRKK